MPLLSVCCPPPHSNNVFWDRVILCSIGLEFRDLPVGMCYHCLAAWWVFFPIFLLGQSNIILSLQNRKLKHRKEVKALSFLEFFMNPIFIYFGLCVSCFILINVSGS